MPNGTGLDGMLLASRDPERLRAWYSAALEPQAESRENQYRMLDFRGFYLVIDHRDDVAATNPDPARVVLNFDVEDARAAVKRIEQAGTRWIAPLEDRDGSLFATATDPDGNYVQVIQLSQEHRNAM
ncbi:VOC family protein [Streptomonospora wellingtoniae]|uniref:VOC family protein n=1 Tax=Streptomonospora wellingtoniae TaxID=3075544 RepID=A0ABU2KQ99_9ACTN|nr:VOC family protein [Streptomonospora sp. DSM 45055]MDT0301445.1 VOC family protein [Streptomonospora sp. DSM 45055]